MLTEARKRLLDSKINFVKRIGDVIKAPLYQRGDEKVSVIPQIERIEYIVHVHKKHEWDEEHLVVTYQGGAQAVRNCTGTSCVGILAEIAKLMNGGYYDEVEHFIHLMTSDEWAVYEPAPNTEEASAI